MGLEFWRHTAILAAAIIQTTFALLYGLTRPWWRSFTGRALLFNAVSFGVLVDTAALGAWLDWPHEEATIVALYWLVVAGALAQLAAFIRTSRGRVYRFVARIRRRLRCR